MREDDGISIALQTMSDTYLETIKNLHDCIDRLEVENAILREQLGKLIKQIDQMIGGRAHE